MMYQNPENDQESLVIDQEGDLFALYFVQEGEEPECLGLLENREEAEIWAMEEAEGLGWI